MSNLKPCPCGKIPERLIVHAEHSCPKWAWVTGSCCDGWGLEFRNDYAWQDSPEQMEKATEAWNTMERAGDSTTHNAKAHDMDIKVGDVLLIETNMKKGREFRTARVTQAFDDRFVYEPLFNKAFTENVGGVADTGAGSLPKNFSPHPSGFGVRSVRVVGRVINDRTYSVPPRLIAGESNA